jgi:hypothetical protein
VNVDSLPQSSYPSSPPKDQDSTLTGLHQHANGCVPSTLHQCVIQWIGNEVEVVQAVEDMCITVTESQVDIQEGNMNCLTGMDLMGYDYVSIGKDGFVPISVKPAIGVTRLAHDLV